MINITEREQKKVKGLIGSCKTANQLTMGNQQGSLSLLNILIKWKPSTTKVFPSGKKMGDLQLVFNDCYNYKNTNARRYSLILHESVSRYITMNTTYYLYKITTTDNYYYIGITSNLKDRINAHCTPSAQYRSAIGAKILECGRSNITVDVINTFTNENDAKNAEFEYVNEHCLNDPLNLNIISGGGKPPKSKANAKAIKINGIVYTSITKAANSLNITRWEIDRLIKNNLIDYEFVDNIKTIDIKCKKIKTENPNCDLIWFDNKCYDSYLTVCKTYNISKTEYIKVRKHFNRDHVTYEEVLSLRVGKKPITINGVTYSSRKEALDSGITNYELYKFINNESKKPASVKINMIDIESNTIIKVFESLADAKNHVNAKTTSGICQCCRGTRNSAYGYKWSYASEPRVAI